MTDEQREAAVEVIAQQRLDHHRDASFMPPIPLDDAAGGETYRIQARATLAALTDAGFVLLHRDDVTEERSHSFGGSYGTRTLARLVTRWEPITKEQS